MITRQTLRISLLQRRTLILSPEIQKSVAEVLRLPPKILTAAETAFACRLGLQDIAEDKFRAALAHPKLPIGNRPGGFDRLRETGEEVLNLLVRDYIRARFPKLPKDSHELAVKVYTADKNLSSVARSTGIEYAVIEFTGIPSITMPTLEAQCNTRRKEKGENPILLRPTELYAQIFNAIIGTIFKEKGALATRNFLDAFLFTGTFNKNLLCQPKNPMLKLARALGNFGMKEPDYRLLHETGRLSDTSIYVVGVYSGEAKLAEAHGPSILVAQERAAIEALRDLFLVDTPRAPRRSDQLLSSEPDIRTAPKLARLLKFE